MAFSYFTFNGYNSLSDCGLYIEQRPAPTRPARDGQFISVPGRSGDVYIDGGKYSNVILRYNVGCPDIKTYLPNIKAMLDTAGYSMLADSYNTTIVRYAVCVNEAAFTEDLLDFGHATIEFNCEPFAFITDSLNFNYKINLKNSSINNPTKFDSLPLIRVYDSTKIIDKKLPSNTLTINNKSYKFDMPMSYMYIDCENCFFYNKSSTGVITNYNEHWLSDSFPVFRPGSNTLTVTGGASEIYAKPRWRTL